MKNIFLLLIITLSFQVHADINQIFNCTDGSSSVNIILGENGQAQMADDTNKIPGNYSYSKNIQFNFPQLGYSDQSTSIKFKHNLITRFSTSHLNCHAIAHTHGEALQGKVECPKVKYIQGAGYQVNYFEFYQNHMVRRFTKDIIFAGNGDTLFSEYYGIYLMFGNKVWMFFGNHENEIELTGSFQGTSLIINELEPNKGSCN